MGHHFDSPESRADSSINITDNYLFAGERPDTVVAIMALSPLAGLPSPYHEGLQATAFRSAMAYELRFDVDGDDRADVVLRWMFDGAGPEQEWTLTYRGDAQGDGPWEPERFSSGRPTTGATNVIAIVAELPLRRISRAPFRFYSSVLVFEHGEWLQVNRCGRPNFAATFVDNPQRSRRYNDTGPDTDLQEFTPDITRVVSALVRVAGTHPNPDGYAQLAARALLPDLIPYDPVLPTSYGFAGINGRGLTDDFGAVVYSTVFNFPMRTALVPFPDVRTTWPYLPEPRPLPSGDAGAALPARREV